MRCRFFEKKRRKKTSWKKGKGYVAEGLVLWVTVDSCEVCIVSAFEKAPQVFRRI